MALRVPGVEVQHEALAVRPRRVELGIRLRRAAEDLAPLPAQPQPEGVVDGVARLVAQDAHAPLVFAAFDFEHLRLLELLEAGVRQVEGDRDRRCAVRREPFVGQIEMYGQTQAAGRQLAPELADYSGRPACPRCGPADRPAGIPAAARPRIRAIRHRFSAEASVRRL